MKRARPAFYAGIYVLLIGVARDNGYALAVHGSMTRDLDLIACPWTEDAVSADRLLREMARVMDGVVVNKKPSRKPHGRVAQSIILEHGADSVYVDVSVMPRSVVA